MKETGLTFNIFIKRDEESYIAHCLELDIVATAPTLEQVKDDINSLIKTQVDFAFNNDNLDNLFHSAPKEVWQEFYACKTEKKVEIQKIEEKQLSKKQIDESIPPFLITNTCISPKKAYSV